MLPGAGAVGAVVIARRRAGRITRSRWRAALRAAAPSGDWRRIGSALRLVGLLAVNVPGFPVPKLSTKYASGVQMALVASGIPNLTESMSEEEMDQWAYRRIMTKLSAKVHGEEG